MIKLEFLISSSIIIEICDHDLIWLGSEQDTYFGIGLIQQNNSVFVLFHNPWRKEEQMWVKTTSSIWYQLLAYE